MAAAWHLIKTFIREATEDAQFQPISDVNTVYAKLRTIQRGQFTAVTTDGMIQISSQIKDTAFTFAVPADLSPADIMAIAEQALGMIQGLTVPQMRALLARRKSTTADFSNYEP